MNVFPLKFKSATELYAGRMVAFNQGFFKGIERAIELKKEIQKMKIAEQRMIEKIHNNENNNK